MGLTVVQVEARARDEIGAICKELGCRRPDLIGALLEAWRYMPMTTQRDILEGKPVVAEKIDLDPARAEQETPWWEELKRHYGTPSVLGAKSRGVARTNDTPAEAKKG